MAGRVKVITPIILASFLPMFSTAATLQFRQGVNGYIGTVDTYIRADQPTVRLQFSLIILVDNDSPIAHGLIRFDHIFGNGPGQVPPSATIESATLTLRTSNESDPVWFHRMLVPWEETNNWTELSTSGPGLQADGIEMAATRDFTFTPSNPVPRVDTFDVTATVQGWLAGDFPNYGWGITNEISNGWQFDSSENAAVTNRPMLAITFHSSPRPVEIVTQPTNVTVVEGDSATFSVVVTGDDPVYQWFKDDVPIAGATNSTYTIPFVLHTDEGVYHVAVSNYFSGPINSSDALLTVLHNEQPSVRCAYGTNDNLTVFVVFSQIVTNGNDPVNYTIVPSGGGAPLTVASAIYPGGTMEGSVVVITLDPSTPLGPGASYTLTVNAVFNRVGDPIDPNEVTPLALYFEPIFRISESQIWKFEDSGNDIGDSWKNANFDDGAWNSGPSLLGFEDAALPEPLRTPVRRTNEAGVVIRTHYFRTHFIYYGPTGEGLLRFRMLVDDAPAIYLNEAEIFRIRLPAGPLNWQTEGVGNAVSNAVYEGPFTVCVSNLIYGDNVLAAEVHQTGQNSSDMVFGLELWGMWPDPPPSPPRFRIALRNGTHAVLTWFGQAILEQNSAITDTNGWTAIHGAESGHTVPVEGTRFFRLRR